MANFRAKLTLLLLGLPLWTAPARAVDRYRSFAELAGAEPEGIAWRIETRTPEPDSAVPGVFAIHGGLIEPGSAEMARKIAEKSPAHLYVFEALRGAKSPEGLHLTSTRFDDPRALTLARSSTVCMSIHGFKDREDPNRRSMILGGNSDTLIHRVKERLASAGGLGISLLRKAHLEARDPRNIVNRCSGGGLQVEASRALREAWIHDPGLLERFASLLDTSLQEAHLNPARRGALTPAAIQGR